MKSMTLPSLSPLFLGPPAGSRIQFFRYVIAGGISSVLDISVFMLCTTVFQSHYLVAQTFGFAIGITSNYLMSIWWIFESNRKFMEEVSLFFLTGLV